MCLQYRWRPEDSIQFPGNLGLELGTVIDEWLCRCWELNLGTLEEQQALQPQVRDYCYLLNNTIMPFSSHLSSLCLLFAFSSSSFFKTHLPLGLVDFELSVILLPLPL